MNIFSLNPSHRGSSRSRSHALRRAIIALFSSPAAQADAALASFTVQEWNANLPWLDTSGLALYLLAELQQRRSEHILPPEVLRRLQQNLQDNRAKSEALLAEAHAVTLSFKQHDVVFAHMKGITLTPHAVPDPSLRLQLDLDLLVDETDAEQARHALEALGYVRASVSGTTWAFKTDGADLPSFDDLYKARSQRVAEVHLTPLDGPMDRCVFVLFGDVLMPTLAAPDLYLQQALHLFKHLCSAFTRAAWLLEYRRHMHARQNDILFWKELEALTADAPHARLGLAVVSALVQQVFGDAPPAPLARLIEGTLSAPVRLWIERYGLSSLCADFPGTKLYLILQAEIAMAGQSRRAALLPLAPPPMITLGHRGEALRSRLKRIRIQAAFFFFRLRFHGLEGARYLLESIRFRRLVAGLRP